MKITIGARENSEVIESNHLKISVEGKEFRLSLNKFGELVVNKHVFDDSEGCIIIAPSVSNEIRLR